VVPESDLRHLHRAVAVEYPDLDDGGGLRLLDESEKLSVSLLCHWHLRVECDAPRASWSG
jgi:hypothetical protein